MPWEPTDKPHVRKWVAPDDPAVDTCITATDGGGHLHIYKHNPGDPDDEPEWWHLCDPGGVRELRDALTALLGEIEFDDLAAQTRFRPPQPPAPPPGAAAPDSTDPASP